jgi:site-specific DNA-methyltransferase (adenine-specific)
MCNGRNLMRLQSEAEKVGFEYQNHLIWEKGNVTPNRYYMGACEFILMLKKGKARTIRNASCPNILKVKNNVGKKHHPTEKPVELMQIFIVNSSDEGDIVIDPFMGSGSTGVACINTNRNFIGIELDEQYFNIASDRINRAKTDWLDNLLGGTECK